MKYKTLSTTSIDPANSVLDYSELDYSDNPGLNVFAIFWLSYAVGLVGLALTLMG